MKPVVVKRFSIILTMLCIGIVAEAAVIPDMRFRRVDTREGLSNSEVFCILRDSQGYVWFGTNYGLNRYDGYRIRTYFSYDKDTTSLRNNRIDEIQEGYGGRLWLKQRMNYTMYDPVTEKVDRNPTRWLNEQGMLGGMESIHLDSKMNYWVKSYEEGFYYFNPVTKNLKHFVFGYGPYEFSKDFGVSAYTETEEGMVLVSTFGELMCIDGEKGKVLWKDPYVKNALNAYNDYWVTTDKQQNLWVITHSVGTYIYVKKEKRWYSSLTEWMRAQGYENVPVDVQVWEVRYDAKGLLWIATDHQGVFVLDEENRQWRQFLNVKGDETSLPDNTIKHLYLDQLGRMWLASYKNGVAMCLESMTNFKSMPIGDINTITEDKEGYYWIGRNDGGIIKMDPKTLEPVEQFTKQSLGVPSDIIVGSYAAKDGGLWFGTYEGGILHYQNGQWKNYRTTDPGSALVTNNIWGITEDKWGNIWVGVLGGGAVRIDKKTGQQRAFTADNSTLNTVWTNSISTGGNGWIVLGNSEYYALINPGNFKIINGTFPTDDDRKAITVSTATTQAVVDSRGLLWQCSPSGVVIYDLKTRQKTLLDMKSGLFGSNAVSVTEDTRHTMWVATDHGVSNITPRKQEDGTWTFTIRNFNSRDGLQPGPFNQRAIFCSRTGELLIGGQEGLDIISTLKLGNGDSKERPVFSGLVLFDQEVEVGQEYDGRVILEQALDMQRSIQLKYEQNQFTIHMASDNGGINNATRFVYQLEGFNDKWIKSSTNNPDITYMSLPPGSYTLCVRMLRDDGTMGEVESRLDITIDAPWYRSWWAIACYVLLIVAVLFLRKPFRRWRRRRKINRLHRQEDMKRLLGLTLLLISLWAGAENTIPDMKFKRLDTRDGLSNSTINCIYQDSKGFVWIGTSYGLNRYDGYRFRTYYSDPNDTTTLRSNYVDQIFEDAAGRLWLRQGMNYSLFDPVTERTVRNPSKQLAEYGVIGGIDRLYIDSKKNIWVKTYDEGLYCNVYGRKKHTLTKYGYEDGLLPKEFYFSSMADWDGMLLVASSDGELIGVDTETGKVRWKDRYMIEHGGKTSEAYNIIVDPEGNYWVLSNLRTFVYDQKAKQWHPSVNSFLEAHGIAPLPDPLQIWDVMTDKRGWIWIGTDHEGVFVIDPKSKEVKQLLNNKFDETSLSDNTVRHMLSDHSGNVWISGYRNGLNQYIETLSGFRTLELGDINTTTEDTQGNYWFGTDNRGVIKYMPKTGETEVYDKARCGFASDVMVASCGAKDGSVWFGTYNGGVVQIANGHVKNYLASNADGALLNNNVWSVTEDKWGDIWVGTLGSGVQKLQTKTGKFLTWNSYNGKMPENFMTSASWTRKGWLLVGHSNYYSLINPVSGKVMNFTIPAIPGQPVAVANTVCVMEDSRELIWQGSTAGCCIFDPKTGQQKLLDMNSGLLGSSVVGIAEDLLHTVWVVTEHGISNVVPKREDNGEWSFLVRSFSSKDGLQQGPYNQRSISRTHDGMILVGGIGGVDIINPKLITNVNNDERPMFSGLKLFGQQMGVGQKYEGRVILEKALDECEELVLRYDENQFTIQLATNRGEIHNPSRFIYQLEGFSDKWMKTEENNPNITYMSLHHGSYILHVRMLNDDGTMGEAEATLKLTITPPLLRNRWLMLLFLACVAAGIWYWRKLFIKKQMEKAELENLRREVEKKQWMNEIKTQMMNQESGDRSQESGDRSQESGVRSQETGDRSQETGVRSQAPEWEITELNRQPADLQEFMKEQCAQFKAPEGKKLKFSFFPLANDLVMPFDRDMMGQAIQILLNNSVMFSPSNCVIKVFVDKTPSAGTIRISDNGIGLPEGAKEHMFDPVVSDDDPGVCLSIVKDIVTAHGGTVIGDNNAGGGSVFTITLPLEQPEEVEEAVLMDEE